MQTVRNVSIPSDTATRSMGRVVWSKLLPTGLLAALVATFANIALYLAASAAGAMSQTFVANGQGPILLPMVATMSVVGAVAGVCVYALLGRFVRRPVRIFRIIAAVALGISFVGPLTIAGAPTAMVATLLLMHVVAAGSSSHCLQ